MEWSNLYRPEGSVSDQIIIEKETNLHPAAVDVNVN